MNQAQTQTIVLGGYSATKELVAQCVTRGGKSVYIVSLPISLVPVLLAVPDPSKPIDLNRAVSKAHAESFGKYWLDSPDSWTVPPLLVDTAQSLVFTADYTVENGPKMGKVQIPEYSNQILRTLDGQHRILGWSLTRAKLLQEESVQSGMMLEAKKSGTAVEQEIISQRLKQIRSDIERMQREQVTLEIITGVTDVEHKTFFVTIADNAQGINTSERTRLDEMNMTSRVAKRLAEEIPLLDRRVEERKASAAKSSKDLVSLANLRDITRHVCFGIKGKVTLVREQQVNDDVAFKLSQHFFDALTSAVPAYLQVQNGTYLPKTLKDESLMGSVTILRCLAGSYNDLAVKRDNNNNLSWNMAGHEKFVSMLTDASKKMKISVVDGDKSINGAWEATGCFNPGEVAPRSRAQDLKNLSALFTAWADSGTVFNPKKLS
jgi:hypothetical protein